MTPRIEPLVEGSYFSVYDGRERMGSIVIASDRITAQLSDGTDLGSFVDQSAAADAISRANGKPVERRRG